MRFRLWENAFKVRQSAVVLPNLEMRIFSSMVQLCLFMSIIALPLVLSCTFSGTFSGGESLESHSVQAFTTLGLWGDGLSCSTRYPNVGLFAIMI